MSSSENRSAPVRPIRLPRRERGGMCNVLTTVREVMTPSPAAVQLEITLGEARERMLEGHFHHLLVYDGEHFVGVLSDRDILRHLSPRLGTAAETRDDLRSLHKRVFHATTFHPLSIEPEAQALDAALVMVEEGISCMPVLEGADVVGIVTTRGLLRALVI